MSTLRELWFGNVKPNENKIITTREKELISKMEEAQNRLLYSLNKYDLEDFNKYINCADKYASLAEAEAFEIGFKLAIKILTE